MRATSSLPAKWWPTWTPEAGGARREAQAQWRLGSTGGSSAQPAGPARERKSGGTAVVVQREAEYVASQKQSIRSTGPGQDRRDLPTDSGQRPGQDAERRAAISARGAQVARRSGHRHGPSQSPRRRPASSPCRRLSKVPSRHQRHELRSPRDGRAIPGARVGEVVAAGGRVLNLCGLATCT